MKRIVGLAWRTYGGLGLVNACCPKPLHAPAAQGITAPLRNDYTEIVSILQRFPLAAFYGDEQRLLQAVAVFRRDFGPKVYIKARSAMVSFYIG